MGPGAATGGHIQLGARVMVTVTGRKCQGSNDDRRVVQGCEKTSVKVRSGGGGGGGWIGWRRWKWCLGGSGVERSSTGERTRELEEIRDGDDFCSFQDRKSVV